MSAKKVISYSLFGYNKPKQQNCFIFNDYLRGLVLNIRLARLLYPDWVVRVHVDHETNEGLKHIFERLPIEVIVLNPEPLTKAMLWRMLPIFDRNVEYVICRDLDSPLTYREAQAVHQWVNSECVVHTITDSVSHGIPMLGGMIGFWAKYFTDYTKISSWKVFSSIGITLNFNVKGTDQDLLNRFIYPYFANPKKSSIMQHYVLGMPNTFLPNYFNHIPDIDIGLPLELKESNDTCGHIGAAGYYVPPMMNFMHKHRDKFNDIREVEKDYPEIFYWTNEGI